MGWDLEYSAWNLVISQKMLAIFLLITLSLLLSKKSDKDNNTNV